jgi:putative membrane-bound dehydrogenase-like protein
MRLRLALLTLSSLLVPPAFAADVPEGMERHARPPEESRRSIRVPAGFVVELAAAEPLVKDPIAFDWGADGSLWVVEMGDYPLGDDGKGKPGGVVRRLEDADGDGRYDKSTVFLDGLGFPNGIIPWRNGVIVSCAPDIFYAEDTDGDGRADRREVLFTGFPEANPQHRANGFEMGLDGWLYAADGNNAVVRSVKTGQTVELGRRDFRIRPDDGRIEPESGPSQFGRHRDDWGRWFGNDNSNWAWHFVLSDADLRRNASFAPPDPRHKLEPDPKLFPISRTVARFNDPQNANRATSANSPTPYRDDLFGPHFATSLFVSEPVHNLVHRMVLEPDGATFRGRRAPGEADREFLASTDNWTRPAMLKTGPDGALWVADMYRAVIEHPEWIPDDWEARIDLRAGSEEGRIYRVRPVDKQPRPIPRLDRLDAAGLVAALDSPNGWQRDTAQRLLLHRRDRSAIAPLRALAGQSPRPKTRLQALWTLQCLEALTPEAVASALGDPHPQVRRNAAKAGEGLLAAGHPALADAYLKLADDPDAEVRLQLALSLGQWKDPRAGRALARLSRRAKDDPWLRAAVLSSATPHVETILTVLFTGAADEPPPAAIIEPLFALAGTVQDGRGRNELARALGTPSLPGGRYADWQFSALAGLLDASERANRPLSPEDDRQLSGLREAARAIARDAEAGDDVRVAATRLLGRDEARRDEDRDLLAGLLRPQNSSRLQQAAVSALGRSRDPKVPDALLDGWKGYSPQLRGAVLDVLMSRDAWTAGLLSSLEDTCTPPSEIDSTHRRRLLDHRNPDLKARAAAVFEQEAGTRLAVVDKYRPALALRGDPAAGAAAFKKACTTCHRLGGEGNEVGPDLSTLTDRSPEALLVAILDPNRAVETKYADFTVHTIDGRVLNGLVASESASAVTLRRQEGKEDTLLRSEIEAMASSGRSLMPEGLENDLKPQDLADLIAYLGTTGPPPRQVAGNHPERVAPGDDGTIALRAETAQIFGETLTYEPEHRNLGYWGRLADRAAWTFDVKQPGRYAVWLEWSCDDTSAGNTLVLDFGPARVEHKVTGTGNWSTYRAAMVGEVTLTAGSHRLDARSAGRVRGALLDLRAVELRPLDTGTER